jgi:hypothetical protein
MKRLPLIVALFATAGLATPRPARDTAEVGNKGSWSVGIFNPLRIAVTDRVELQAHPLVFFVAPNIDVRFGIWKPQDEGLRLTAEAGLSLPTFGMRLMKGFFFPSWETSTNDIGWMLIPRFGLLLSGRLFEHDVWTVRADAAFRLALGPNNATPLNSFLAPLDLLLAAPLTGFVTRGGIAYDKALGDRFRLRGELNLYVTGAQGNLIVGAANVGPIAPLSSIYITSHLGLDIAVFQQSRITVGALWANYDQGATEVITRADGFSERVRVRSNNFLPTIDYIWAGW